MFNCKIIVCFYAKLTNLLVSYISELWEVSLYIVCCHTDIYGPVCRRVWRQVASLAGRVRTANRAGRVLVLPAAPHHLPGTAIPASPWLSVVPFYHAHFVEPCCASSHLCLHDRALDSVWRRLCVSGDARSCGRVVLFTDIATALPTSHCQIIRLAISLPGIVITSFQCWHTSAVIFFTDKCVFCSCIQLQTARDACFYKYVTGFLQFCIDAFGGHSHMQVYDNIILAALEFDLHQVIRESR